MTKAKKILRIMLTVLMLCSFMIVGTTSVSATSITADQAISWCQSKLGQGVEYSIDKYRYQCVDFIQAYYAYLGVTPSTGSGYQYATNTVPSGWTRTKGGTPQKGDILVYTGGYGHVSIHESNNISYHQNWNYPYVQKVSRAYNQSYTVTEDGVKVTKTYWGCIHPNFSGGNPVPTGNNPTGCVDIVESKSSGTIHIRGWAFDLDNPTKSLEMHVYIGGPSGSSKAEGHPGIIANQSRPDVANVYSKYNVGNNHGFDATIKTSKTGNQPVYIYAINIGGGNSNPLIGGKSYTTNIVPVYNPQGYLDNADSPSPGKLHVRGWAFDKDNVNTALDIHIYVGGPAGSGAPCYAIKANKERPDVNKVFAGVGNYHGFDETINVSKSGSQKVYAYAINVGGGTSNPNLTNSPKTVTITPAYNPEGYLDNVDSPSPGKLHVRGWTFDKDNVNTALTVHIYVGGPAGSGAPCYAITANKERPDVNKQKGCGNYHGFDETINVSKSGNLQVYAYAINIGGGTSNPNLTNSPKTVTIKADTEAPMITDIYQDNFTSEGYTLNFTVSDNTALSSVTVYTNINGNNRKEEVIKLSGQTQKVTYKVKYSNFDTNSGYKHGIWLYDIAGNLTKSPWIEVDAYNPTKAQSTEMEQTQPHTIGIEPTTAEPTEPQSTETEPAVVEITEPETTNPSEIKELEIVTNDDYEYLTIDDGTIKIMKYIGYDSEITIPSEIDGKKVSIIGNSAFGYCQNLKSVIISEGINIIDDYAFNFCINLSVISIPNTVTRIGSYAFQGCQSLTDIKIPESVKDIEAYTFHICSNLKNVTIPNSIGTIGEQAFSGEKLKSIYIPDSVYDIKSAAFAFCTNLENITVDENNLNYTSKNGVLYNKTMTSLVQYPAGKKDKKYTIPNGIKEIRCWSLYCGNLKSVVIPKSVNNIEKDDTVYSPYFPDVKVTWMNGSVVESFSFRIYAIGYGKLNIYGYPYTYAEKYFGSSLILLEKKTNTITVKFKNATVKLKKLKKKAQTVKAITVKNAKGKVSYKLVKKGSTAKIFKLAKINSKGVITLSKWKKAKKGNYKLKVKITAAGNTNYNKKTVNKVVNIKIR